MYSSINIANELLRLANAEKRTITPMQLIKLVFLCHGWMLGLYGRHLINEPVEAWKYGPVISELYHHVKRYRSNPVCFPISDPKPSTLDPCAGDLVTQVYKRYKNFSGIELSSLTHEKDSPWYTTWHSGGKFISNDLIEYYYKNLAQ